MVQKSGALRAAAAVLAAALPLAGCPAPGSRPDVPAAASQLPQAPAPAAPAVPPAAPPPYAVPRAPPAPRDHHLSPATRSLVTQSHALLARGDLDGAAASLERAVRIEPNNPLVWIELGRLRLAENDPHQGEGCGRKALSLASGDRASQAQAGRLLADALRAQGRNPEAVDVERQPFMR